MASYRLRFTLAITSFILLSLPQVYGQQDSLKNKEVRFFGGFVNNVAIYEQRIQFDNLSDLDRFTSTFGGHLGLSKPLLSNINVTFLVGYLLRWQYYQEFSNYGNSTESSSFNVKYASIGLSHDFNLKREDTKLRVALSGDYNIPGKFEANKNGFQFEGVSYGNNFGYQARVGMLWNFHNIDNLIYAGFRKMDFELTDYAQGNAGDLDQSMVDLKADCIFLGLDIFF